jgi:hypothetical protein
MNPVLIAVGDSMSILRDSANSKRQGDVGVAMAISWFMRNGFRIFLPLGDYPDVDLVVGMDDKLYNVQVKTTTYKSPAGNYIANLKVSGGNRSGAGKSKHFDPTLVDYVFVYAEDESLYFIPSYAIEARAMISLCEKYEKYRVG